MKIATFSSILKKGYILLPVLLVAGLSACAQDRDIDDYNRDKAEKDRTKALAIAKVYLGTLKFEKDSSDVGPMGLQLSATSVPDDFNSTKPVLTGQLVFQATNAIPVSFTTGTFNPDDSSFQLTTDVAFPSMTKTVTLSLTGQVKDDVVNGKLEVVGEEGYGGTFTLTAKPDVKNVQGYMTNEGTTGEPIDAFSTEYTGVSTTRNYDYPGQAHLLLSNTSSALTDSVRFANLFQRKKIVAAVLDISYQLTSTPSKPVIVTYSFNNAEWDPSTGVLEGSIQNSMSNNLQHLRCTAKTNADVGGTLGCVLDINATNSTTLDIVIDPVKK